MRLVGRVYDIVWAAGIFAVGVLLLTLWSGESIWMRLLAIALVVGGVWMSRDALLAWRARRSD